MVNGDINNLLELWEQSTVSQRQAGCAWYLTAHNIAYGWHEATGYSLAQVSGVIAALSPQTNWGRNLELAKRVLIEKEVKGTFGASLRKAELILKTPADIERLQGVATFETWFNPKMAPKTFNFFHNILNPWDHDYVTVDRHAISAFYGCKQADVKTTGKPIRFKEYTRIADAYKAAAHKVGQIPCEFQATLWLMIPKGPGKEWALIPRQA